MVISDKNGWPKIDEFMGRFIFILWDMDGKTTKIREMYSENTDGLKGRLFFTSFYEYEKENDDETMFGKLWHCARHMLHKFGDTLKRHTTAETKWQETAKNGGKLI